jgi:hypothetical protein
MYDELDPEMMLEDEPELENSPTGEEKEEVENEDDDKEEEEAADEEAL